MNVAAWIGGVLLIAVFLFSGATKIIDLDRQREHFGYTASQFRMLGMAELLAAVGILVGLIWRGVEWIAGAAAVGICVLMVGALMAHARMGDEVKATIPAAVMFVLSIVFIVLVSLR